MTRLCASSCFAFDVLFIPRSWTPDVLVFSYYWVCFATDRTILSSINSSKLFTNNQIPDATETVLPNLLPKPQITVALHQRSLVAIKPYFGWSIDNDTCALEIDSLWSTNSSVFILGCKIDCFMHVDLEDKKKEGSQWPGFWGWNDLKMNELTGVHFTPTGTCWYLFEVLESSWVFLCHKNSVSGWKINQEGEIYQVLRSWNVHSS